MKKNDHHNRIPFTPAKICLAISTILFSSHLFSAETVEQDDEDNAIDKERRIVVTAQHREENPQEVPIAISLFQSDQLKDMAAINISDLGELTPGFESNNVSFTQPTYNIRGIASNDFGIGSDPAVAVYVDGVYVGRGGASQANFNDIERVEILKGPQGTLFGRNAAAGTLQVITKKPERDTSGSFGVTFGNYNRVQINGMYNTEIADNLYLRTSVASIQRDGFIPVVGGGADLTDIDNQSLRASLLWDYSESTDVLFRFDYDTVSQDAPITASINPGIAPANPFGAVETDIDALEQRDLWGVSMEINADYSDYVLTYIASYRTFDSSSLEEEDGSANNRFFFATQNNEEQEQVSHELRLSSKGNDDVKWTIGGTYFWEEAEQAHEVFINTNTLDTFFYVAGGAPAAAVPLLPLGGGLSGFFNSEFTNQLTLLSVLSGIPADTILDMTVAANLNRDWVETTYDEGTYTSIAMYGDFTFALNEQLNLTFGLRYTHDKKNFAITSQWDNSFIIPIPGVDPVPFGLVFFDQFDGSQQQNSWDAWTPRVVLDYQLNDHFMMYASSAKGFKSGGFNSLGLDPAFAAENVINNEIGFKSSWLEDLLIFNLALYSYQYDDLQILKLTGADGTIPTYNIGNADAEGDGFDIDFNWQVTDNFNVTANYGHINTEYTRYDYTQFPGETAANDLTGEALSSIPENKWNLILDYNLAIGEAGDLGIRVHQNFTDDRVDHTNADQSRHIDDFSLTNARISYYPNNADWEVSIWGRNLGDEEYLYSIGGQGEAIGSPTTSRAEPRTYGLDFRMFF